MGVVIRLGLVEPVCNRTVEGWHTYHVGELDVWVHNVCRFDRIIRVFQATDITRQDYDALIARMPELKANEVAGAIRFERQTGHRLFPAGQERDGDFYYLREDGTHVSVDHMGSVGPVARPADFQNSILDHLEKRGIDEIVIDVTDMPELDVQNYRRFAQEQASILNAGGYSTPSIFWLDTQ